MDGERLYSALFVMLALTSLRFGGTRQVRALWLSDSALCGLSVNNKDKSGNLMNRRPLYYGFPTRRTGLASSLNYGLRSRVKTGRITGHYSHISSSGGKSIMRTPRRMASRIRHGVKFRVFE